MRIGGLQKLTLIDYPDKVSAVVFTQGCNFRCPYCYNSDLVDLGATSSNISEEEVFTFLESRRMNYKNLFIARIKKYVRDNISSPLSLDQIGSYTNMNSSYVSFLFKETTGITLTEFINEIRMETAKKMLRESNQKISEIAKAVGYGSQRYFCQVFKKTERMTAGDYRNRYAEHPAE